MSQRVSRALSNLHMHSETTGDVQPAETVRKGLDAVLVEAVLVLW